MIQDLKFGLQVNIYWYSSDINCESYVNFVWTVSKIRRTNGDLAWNKSSRFDDQNLDCRSCSHPSMWCSSWSSNKTQEILKTNLIWPCTTSVLTENSCPGAPQKLRNGPYTVSILLTHSLPYHQCIARV